MEQGEKSGESLTHHQRLGDVAAAALVLGVPKSWVYFHTRRNTIPLIRLGKYVRFDLDRLIEWARAGCPAE